MEVERETETPITVAGELVTALERATLMAKQLPTTTDPSQLLQILSTLHSAQRHLSLFLSHHPPPPLHLPQPTIIPTPPPENSVSSAVGGGEENDETGWGEPMLLGDDEDEQSSRAATSAAAVEKVVGRMRECFIQNKRPKRLLSPSAAAVERWRSYDNEAERDGAVAGMAAEFDPIGTKLRSLDLIYQFHA